MHMVQHILLLDVVPILLILGLTRVILRPVARPLLRVERGAGIFAQPGVRDLPLRRRDVGLAHPGALRRRARAPAWSTCSSTCSSRARERCTGGTCCRRSAAGSLGGMGPVVYMATTKLFVGVLGIALAFAPEALYAFYEDQPRYWGLSAGTDQAVGGLIMATEQSIIMGIALVTLFVRALSESEREEQRRERYGEARPRPARAPGRRPSRGAASRGAPRAPPR